jgi:hypothetical protein
MSFLKKQLKCKSDLLGDRVSRVFLRASVMLLGGYRDALRLLPGQQITFHEDQFIRSRPTAWRPFLRQLLHLQTFRQFIEQRLEQLNAGSGLDDEFESELNANDGWSNSSQFSHQYKHWVGQVKRDGGAVLRSVQPAVRSAYRRLKDHSRRAVHGLRDKMTIDSGHDRSASFDPIRSIDPPHLRSDSKLLCSLSSSSSTPHSSPLSSHGSPFTSPLPLTTKPPNRQAPVRSCSLNVLHLHSERDLISFHT